MEDVLARTQIPRTALPDLLEEAPCLRGRREETGDAQQVRQAGVAMSTVRRVRFLLLSGIAGPTALAAQEEGPARDA